MKIKGGYSENGPFKRFTPKQVFELKVGGGAERARGRCSAEEARCTAGDRGGARLSIIAHAITKMATGAPTSKM